MVKQGFHISVVCDCEAVCARGLAASGNKRSWQRLGSGTRSGARAKVNDFVAWINFIGSGASIFSLFVSAITLYYVSRLRERLKEHARQYQYSEIIDQVIGLPASKRVLPASTLRDVKWLIATVRKTDLSRIWFVDRRAKDILTDIERSLEGTQEVEAIKNNLKLLKTEITIR